MAFIKERIVVCNTPTSGDRVSYSASGAVLRLTARNAPPKNLGREARPPSFKGSFGRVRAGVTRSSASLWRSLTPAALASSALRLSVKCVRGRADAGVQCGVSI